MSSLPPNSRQSEDLNPHNLFKLEVDQLLKYLFSLKPSIPETPGDWRQGIRNGLVNEFANAANEYRDLAIKIIPCAPENDQNPPVEYLYGEALRKISHHVSVLASLFVRLGDEPTGNERLSRLEAIQAIIWHISKDAIDGPPILIPVLASQFMYANLPYVNRIGFIGVPLYGLVRPYPDLPILWHEVGGYQVGQDRVTKRLKKQAEDLKTWLSEAPYGDKKLWDSYRDAYEQTALQNEQLKLKIARDSFSIIVPTTILNPLAHGELNRKVENIDTDSHWQVIWLGQFLADCFGLQALGHTMLESLRIALPRAYKTQGQTDLEHPEPRLRLQVAREYLGEEGIGDLEAGKEESDKIVELAKAIAAYLHTLPKHPQSEKVVQEGESIVQLVTRLVDNALGPQSAQYDAVTVAHSETLPVKGNIEERLLKVETALQGLTVHPAVRTAFEDCRERWSSIVVEGSDLIWTRAGFKTEDQRNQIKVGELCSSPREAQKWLIAFQRIKFMETDEIAPPKGQPAWPITK